MTVKARRLKDTGNVTILIITTNHEDFLKGIFGFFAAQTTSLNINETETNIASAGV